MSVLFWLGFALALVFPSGRGFVFNEIQDSLTKYETTLQALLMTIWIFVRLLLHVT